MSTISKLTRSSFLAAIVFMGLSACNRTQGPGVVQAQDQVGNPADGNLAPVDQGSAQNQSVAYPQAAYPQNDQQQPYPPAPGAAPGDPNYYPDDSYDTASNQQPIYATQPPPPLPEYEQPPAPGDDYLWTPGYWSYGQYGYYWVPGAWVIAPYVGALWTPPYWGYGDGRYMWHGGYWGLHIGFYGGVNYGFGYTGRGYYGAYWNSGRIYYNRSVTNINIANIHNVYNYSVPSINRTRVSYNGGRGGINIRPIPAELTAARGPRVPPVSAQIEHAREASGNRGQWASVNGGRPQTFAAARPLATPYRAPAARAPEQQRPVQQPRPFDQNRGQAGRPEPQTRGQLPQTPRVNGQENRGPENRGPENRGPENRVAPAQAQRPEFRPNPAAAPQGRPEQPAPQQRPDFRRGPEGRQQQSRPAPEARPAPQPAARPEARPAPAPRPEARPEARPAPPPRSEARPEGRPAARPEARPAPAPRPAAQPEARQPGGRPGPGGRGEERKER